MIDRVRAYIRDHHLVAAGDRVAVAVSGGADSVALLRVLLELREPLGIALTVAHFHHGIRGAEADGDLEFVRELAGKFSLEFHSGSGDAPSHARLRKISLEAAARELRHLWFGQLVDQRRADKIATAHTLDDQAESVLMRLLRGAAARGLAGIFPAHQERRLVRPLLGITRGEVEAYLLTAGQTWREDSTNRDLAHTRNRVRHQLLPLLERDFNPSVRRALADIAEVSRAEAEYWNGEVASLLSRLARRGRPSRSGRSTSGESAGAVALDLAALRALPLAVQRQILHTIAGQMGVSLEFRHVEQLVQLVQTAEGGRAGGSRLALPGGLTAVRSFRELRFSPAVAVVAAENYQYCLSVPGEVAVPELGSIIHARVVTGPQTGFDYPPLLLNRARLASELTVRNWRPGDRFFPARTKAPKKLKELLEPGRMPGEISPAQRKRWPVVESAGEIVWVRGFPVPEALASSLEDAEAVIIEETELEVG